MKTRTFGFFLSFGLIILIAIAVWAGYEYDQMVKLQSVRVQELEVLLAESNDHGSKLMAEMAEKETEVASLKKLLQGEKDLSSKLMTDLGKEGEELASLELEVSNLRCQLTAFCLAVLSSRPDWNDLKDTISPSDNEISRDDLQDSLVELSGKWPIQWVSLPQADLVKIAVLYVRFKESSDALHEEWKEYNATAAKDDPNRGALWRKNYDELSGKRNGFIYELRKIRRSEVDDLKL